MQQIIGIILSIILFIPIFLLILISSIDIQRNGLFSQERIGLNGKVFQLFKIRTLKGNPSSTVTNQTMERTKLGAFLRKTKLDELPQIFNIALGQMNFVGPRPDVSYYYNTLSPQNFRLLTSIKPGITGEAQLHFKNEEEILNKQEDPELYYENVLWKEKVKINLHYIKNRSLKKDLQIIIKTLF